VAPARTLHLRARILELLLVESLLLARLLLRALALGRELGLLCLQLAQLGLALAECTLERREVGVVQRQLLVASLKQLGDRPVSLVSTVLAPVLQRSP